MDIDDDYIYFNSWVDLGKQIPYTSEDMKEIKWQKYKKILSQTDPLYSQFGIIDL